MTRLSKSAKMDRELGHEKNNFYVMFKGSKSFWKVFAKKASAEKAAETLRKKGREVRVGPTSASVSEAIEESTPKFKSSVDNILNKRKKKNISSKDKDTLTKISKMMKKANEAKLSHADFTVQGGDTWNVTVKKGNSGNTMVRGIKFPKGTSKAEVSKLLNKKIGKSKIVKFELSESKEGYETMDEAAKFKVGQKVKINKPGHDWHGKSGKVLQGAKGGRTKNDTFSVGTAGTLMSSSFKSAELTSEAKTSKNFVQLRTEAVKSTNPGSGFHGTIDKGDPDKEFAAMHAKIQKMVSHASTKTITHFLDSTHGRHVGGEPDASIKRRFIKFMKSYKPSMFESVDESVRVGPNDCKKCKGTGKLDHKTKCPHCSGTGIKKNKNESVEQVDEISKKLAGRYVKKAVKDTERLSGDRSAAKVHQAYTGSNTAADKYDKKASRKLKNRNKGVGRAVDRMTKYEYYDLKHPTEEYDQIDEAVTVKKQKLSFGNVVTISKGNSYSVILHDKEHKLAGKLEDGEKFSFSDDTGETWMAERKKKNLVFVGVRKKIIVPADKVISESVEQIDELSKGKLKKYIKNADKDMDKTIKKQRSYRDAGDNRAGDDLDSKIGKRDLGTMRAKAKIGKPERGGRGTANQAKIKAESVDEGKLKDMSHDDFMKYGDKVGRGNKEWSDERKRRYRNDTARAGRERRKSQKESVEQIDELTFRKTSPEEKSAIKKVKPGIIYRAKRKLGLDNPMGNNSDMKKAAAIGRQMGADAHKKRTGEISAMAKDIAKISPALSKVVTQNNNLKELKYAMNKVDSTTRNQVISIVKKHGYEVNVSGSNGKINSIKESVEQIDELTDKQKAEIAKRKAMRQDQAAKKKEKTAAKKKEKEDNTTKRDSYDKADKNVIMQLRKAQDMDGNFDLEFHRGKKGRASSEDIDAVLSFHDALAKPDDKRKMRIQLAKGGPSAVKKLADIYRKTSSKYK